PTACYLHFKIPLTPRSQHSTLLPYTTLFRSFLRITDRKKDLFISAGGKNIAPQYIETQLKFSPYINDAVAVGAELELVFDVLGRSEEHTSELQSRENLACRLLLEKKNLKLNA